MTSLGIALATAAIQVTLAALIATIVVAAVARRNPRAGVVLAAAALGLCGSLSLAALAPLPGWWTWDTLPPPADRPAEVIAGETPAPPTVVGGITIPLRRLAAVLPSAAEIAHHEESARSVWPILAALFIAGGAVETFRLSAGLIGVAAVRRRSKPIVDPDLDAEVDHLHRLLGVRTAVAVQASDEVGTAATVGWRRPMILLAADWRTWDATERRAVLAHELAHVRRRDYGIGLLAATAQAVHFYHPFVRRLASQLRLHQELAADALAAAVAGGREVYRRALAGMALRQDGVLSAGVARPFFSDRNSLLRRLAMLRVTDDARPLSRAVRWGLAGVLVAAAVTASAIRGTAQPPAAPAAANEVPPFDLSLAPANIDGVVVMRPAALLTRPEMKPVAEAWNRLLAEYLRECGFGDVSVPLGEIEQVVGPFELKTLSAEERKKNPNGEGHALAMGLTAIRMTSGFDWAAKLNAVPPALGLKTIKPGTYEFRAPMLGPNPATLRTPDPRTLVFNQPEPPARSGDAAGRWGAAGKHVERAGFAVLLDNSRGQWTDQAAGEPSAMAVMAVLGKPVRLTYGLCWGERFGVAAAVEYADAAAAADFERRIAASRPLVAAALAAHKPADASEQVLHDLVADVLRTATVRQDGKLVTVDATSSRRWVDLLSAIPVEGPAKGKVSVDVKEQNP